MSACRLLPLSALALLAGCAGSPEQRPRAERTAQGDSAALARELRGLVPGSTTMCLPPLRQLNVRSYGPTLLYVFDRGTKYRVDTNGGCEGLTRRDDILVTVSNQGRTCSGDIANTVDRNSGFTTGSCALGRFTVYRRPERGR